MKKELIITSVVIFVVGVLVAGVNYFVVSQATVQTWNKIDESNTTKTNTIDDDKALLTGLALDGLSDDRDIFVKVEISGSWAKTTDHVLEWDKEKGYVEVPMGTLGNYWLKTDSKWESKGAIMYGGSMDETLKPYADEIPANLK